MASPESTSCPLTYTVGEHLYHSFPEELQKLISQGTSEQRKQLQRNVPQAVIDIYTESDVLVKNGKRVARNAWIEPLKRTVLTIADSLQLAPDIRDKLLHKAAQERTVFKRQLNYGMNNVQEHTDPAYREKRNDEFLNRLQTVYARLSRNNHPENV